MRGGCARFYYVYVHNKTSHSSFLQKYNNNQCAIAWKLWAECYVIKLQPPASKPSCN